MLTADQYDRLGPTAGAIVDTDRQIAAIVGGPVVPIHVAKPGGALRELLNDRRMLTSRANEIWGRPLRSDGSALA